MGWEEEGKDGKDMNRNGREGRKEWKKEDRKGKGLGGKGGEGYLWFSLAISSGVSRTLVLEVSSLVLTDTEVFLNKENG